MVSKGSREPSSSKGSRLFPEDPALHEIYGSGSKSTLEHASNKRVPGPRGTSVIGSGQPRLRREKSTQRENLKVWSIRENHLDLSCSFEGLVRTVTVGVVYLVEADIRER